MSANSDQAFKKLLGQAGKSYVESEDPKNKAAETRLYLAIIGILAFTGVEAVKVVFRKNFGVAGLNMLRLIFCFLCFASISIIAFNCVNSTDSFATDSGTSDSHFLTGVFYTILAIVILVKGISERMKSIKLQLLNDYEGDSSLLSFLIKDGWSQNLIQNLAEPLLTLALGIAFCFFDRIAGIPLIFCAISAWAYILYEYTVGDGSMHTTVNRINTDLNPERSFNEVNPDEE